MFQFIAVKACLIIGLLCSCLSVSQAKLLDPFEARKAPISEFIDWVAMQSGENIILGRGVDGVISVHVKSLDSSEVLHFFSQVMLSNGYVVLKEDDFYKVVIDTEQEVNFVPIFSKIYKLNYLRNTKAMDVFNSILLSSVVSHGTPSEKEVSQYDKSHHSVNVLTTSNAILVSGTHSQIEALDEFVKQIDVDVRQVIIEAVIIETDIGNSKDLGVNISSALSQNGFTVISNAISSVSNIALLGEGGHVVFSDGGDIQSLVTALVKDNDTKILSTPNILVMDRERGHISVGQNVPFLVSRELTNGGSTIQQIERKDVGVTLTVIPHILESGQIILQINQESSSVTSSTQASDIITNKRSISTVVKVNDGETIALGGLVSDETRFSESGVPLLKDIPWLGRLFRSESKETVQRELTVMIKTIIL